MNKEDEMKEVELNEMDQEKQPMTGQTPTGTEKNGSVKVKVPEDAEVKFTGLSKEELMKVAGTAGWVRTRWALLVLFWLGWVGMLAGAIVIIVQAPRCKPIPEMHWWNEGPLYQISNLDAFSKNGLKGVEEKLDYLSQMKVKGLVLGPVHSVQADQSSALELTSINPDFGSESELTSLLDRAHRKGISIVLDLTPNYRGVSSWFNNAASVAEKLKKACVYWLNKGVDGIFLSDLNDIVNTYAWPSIQAIFNKTDGTPKKALMGTASSLSVDETSLLLNQSGVDLLLTKLPYPAGLSGRQATLMQRLCSGHQEASLGWGLGQTAGSQASRTPALPVKLYQTLLFALPGTPVFSAGDELGLKAGEAMWEDVNSTAEEERTAVRNFFKTLSDLKGKERSLLHGEYVNLHNSPTSLAFLRLWDQSERFMVAVNWGNDSISMTLTNDDLPAEARVRATTDIEKLAVDSKVKLEKLELGSKQAVLLSYPFPG
nr:Slc3a2 protein [Danio rerio]